MGDGGGPARRLIAGDFDGTRRRPLGLRPAVDAARAVDWASARLGLARPAVLVSGFWRSGTTWVQECLAEALGAKTVFEPLSPLDPRRRAMMGRDLSYDGFQAAMPRALADNDPLWLFLDHACTGRHTSNFILNCRTGVGESFRTRIVVKDVRMHFNLDGFHRRFGVPVIHLRRHPCAVAASLMAADWDWSFARVSLADLLPAAADRDAVLRRCDGDALSRIAAWWSVAERHASASLVGRPWARVVLYEDLAADPAPGFAALCGWLGLLQRRVPRFGRVSASTAGTGGRPDRWRSALSRDEIARVESVVTGIAPGCLDAWGGPSGPSREPSPPRPRWLHDRENAMADDTSSRSADPAPVAVDETDRLIASDKVEGTEVFGRDGSRIGAIYNFMVDKVTGRVAYAVVSFGGFLGLGERFFPLPWEALTYDPARGGYVVDIDRETLDRAPSFAPGEEPWRDPEHRRNVFGFYGFNYGL